MGSFAKEKNQTDIIAAFSSSSRYLDLIGKGCEHSKLYVQLVVFLFVVLFISHFDVLGGTLVLIVSDSVSLLTFYFRSVSVM